MKHLKSDFTPSELRKFRRLKTPHGIQQALDAMPYHLEDTAWSPPPRPRENTSPAMRSPVAAAALRLNGYPPLILDLEASTIPTMSSPSIKSMDLGAVAKSNYTGCRYREPVYRTSASWPSATSIPTSTCARCALYAPFQGPCTCSASTLSTG